MLTPSKVRSIVADHDTYWNDRRSALSQLHALYMTEFWQDRDPQTRNARRTLGVVEVPKAYEMVESYLGSLFAKNPAVLVTPDIRGRGNPQVAQATANQYLLNIREQLEDATRLALIYPCAFIKMSPGPSVDPLQRVNASATPPWEVIVDFTASAWNLQRWVGHAYLMPRDEAVTRYGKEADDFNARIYSDWLDALAEGVTAEKQENDGDLFVRVVEMYDLDNDKMLVWSADYANGDDFLFEGVKIQVGALESDAEEMTDPEDAGEIVHETTGIPYKSASGRPIVPIIPMYYSRDPKSPLRGYSLLHRSKDQFTELNFIRTYQSRGVRKMARQWLVRAGFLGETAVTKIAAGVDGEIIEVDLGPGEDLDGNMITVPQAPIPADITLYGQQTESDLQAGGVLAPFTRGEVTKSTATEQRNLAAYTSSEIGRMARTRDAVVAGIANVFNVMLSVILGDDMEPLSLPNPVGPTMLSAEDLTGDFNYWAQDAGSTPLSDLAKQENFLLLLPVLERLGVPRERLLEELVRSNQLSEDFMVAEQAQTEAPADTIEADQGAVPPNDAPPPGEF